VLSDEILVLPGAYDALSAKIVEQAGFKAVTLGGYPASASLLAKPDVSLLTLTEMVNQARYITESVDIPLFVDGDTGHGNVTNVARTVRLFENAAVAGLLLKIRYSQALRPHGRKAGDFRGRDDYQDQGSSGCEERRRPDAHARTDSLAVYGIEEAIERGNRFAEAGLISYSLKHRLHLKI